MHTTDHMPLPAISRRRFLKCSMVAGAIGPSLLARAQESHGMRAAIIGHTGQGNYGHDLDLIFNGRKGIQVVAVADPDAQGRAKAAGRSGAVRQYNDYREMLDQEKPHLVCVAPRWTDQHYAIGMAALKAGAHIYIEKPLTQTLAEADDLLNTAKKAGLKIAVAHQMRIAPNILALKKGVDGGLIGEVLELHAYGKQDHRAGGEDLIVLGVHLFDLMRYFAGEPAWCTARVLQDGREITRADARPATESIGPVAGNEITAEFGFPNSLHATFTSRAKIRDLTGPWGIEFVGTTGSIKILMEMVPRIYMSKRSAWTDKGKTDEWLLWDADPAAGVQPVDRTTTKANGRVVDDWLSAIADNRQPICSGFAAMKALEMAHAILAAGLAKTRVDLPLKNRQHPMEV